MYHSVCNRYIYLYIVLMYLHIYIHMHLSIYLYIYIYIDMHTMPCLYTLACVCVCVCLCIAMRMHTYTLVYVCVCVRLGIHIANWASAPVIASHAGLYAAGNLARAPDASKLTNSDPNPNPKPHPEPNPKPDAEPNPKPDAEPNPKPDQPKKRKGIESYEMKTPPPPGPTRGYSFDSAWRADGTPSPLTGTPASSIALGFSPGAETSPDKVKSNRSPRKGPGGKPSPKKSSPSKLSSTPSLSKDSSLSQQTPSETTNSSHPSLKRAPSEVSVSSSKMAKFDKYYYRFLGLQLALLHV